MKPKIWITYAWADNENGDIDFIAQELTKAGAVVNLDRWNLSAGGRLWEQIADFICSESHSDAWLLVATANSLSSEPCKEEFAFALERALSSRGRHYPVIGLFLGPTDAALIPASIKTRLYVSLTDKDWRERIIAAAQGERPNIDKPTVLPFEFRVHKTRNEAKPFAIELRPRADMWTPFFVAIPNIERASVDPHIMSGPRGRPTNAGVLIGMQQGETADGENWLIGSHTPATPTESYYLWCAQLPSRLVFGEEGAPNKIFTVESRG